MELGIIVKGRQIIIPKSLVPDILQQLHSGHQGIEKTRRLARESCYWPNMNADIEKLCKSCNTCQTRQSAPPKQPLKPHEVPVKPWQYIASDLFDVSGKQYLLTVDRYSKFQIVEELPSASSKAVTEKIKLYCSFFGRPDEIMTDNGTQYTGQAFQKFIQNWEIHHVTSSPHYPQSNGFIERHVRTIKTVVQKCLDEGEDIQMALMNIRATPVDTELPSPAEMMFGKPITTLLPSRSQPGQEKHRKQLENRSDKMKQQYDRTAKSDLPPLEPGQRIRVKNPDSKLWSPGIVLKRFDDDSYMLETWNGSMIRRTRSHIRRVDHPPSASKNVRFAPPNQPQPTPTENGANNQSRSEQPSRELPPPRDAIKEPDKAPSPRRSNRVIRKPKRFEQ